MSEKKWVDCKVAQILLSKDKKTEYLKFTKDVSFKEGETCFLHDFAQGIDKSVEQGKISKEKGDQLKEKQSFVLFNVEVALDKAKEL